MMIYFYKLLILSLVFSPICCGNQFTEVTAIKHAWVSGYLRDLRQVISGIEFDHKVNAQALNCFEIYKDNSKISEFKDLNKISEALLIVFNCVEIECMKLVSINSSGEFLMPMTSRTSIHYSIRLIYESEQFRVSFLVNEDNLTVYYSSKISGLIEINRLLDRPVDKDLLAQNLDNWLSVPSSSSP